MEEIDIGTLVSTFEHGLLEQSKTGPPLSLTSYFTVWSLLRHTAVVIQSTCESQDGLHCRMEWEVCFQAP